VLSNATLNDPNQAESDHLAPRWQMGRPFLQTEVAISATALLVFASNTGHHRCLSRLYGSSPAWNSFQASFLKRNKTPQIHPISPLCWPPGIPIAILIAVNGRIILLGDMYAFGLLGAFSLTCLAWILCGIGNAKAARKLAHRQSYSCPEWFWCLRPNLDDDHHNHSNKCSDTHGNGNPQYCRTRRPGNHPSNSGSIRLWHTTDFYLGMLTTAWSSGLEYQSGRQGLWQPAFGGVRFVWYGHRGFNYNLNPPAGRSPGRRSHRCRGSYPRFGPGRAHRQNGRNEAIIRTAISIADGKHIVFLFLGTPGPDRIPRNVRGH